MLQFTGSQRVRHDLAAEQQKQQMDMLTTEVSRKCLDEDINRGCISAQMVFKTFGTQWLQVGDSGPRHLFSSFSFPKSQPPYSQLPIISLLCLQLSLLSLLLAVTSLFILNVFICFS